MGPEYEEIGRRIKALRRSNKLTQDDLADALGISKSAVVNYELGTRRVPLSLIIKIAEYFEVSIDNLAGLGVAGVNKNEHLIFSNNPEMIEKTRRWYDEVGAIDLSDEELGELISFANYLIYRRGEK